MGCRSWNSVSVHDVQSSHGARKRLHARVPRTSATPARLTARARVPPPQVALRGATEWVAYVAEIEKKPTPFGSCSGVHS